MAYIETIEPGKADGKLATLYTAIERQRGHVSNIWKLQSLEPEFLSHNLGMYAATMLTEGGLSKLEREAIALSVSAANECRYCLHHHSEGLRKAGGSDELVDCLAEGAEPDLESARLQRLVYYARKLTLLPNSMNRADVESLRVVGLSDAEILQAVQITAYYNYVNRVADALGAEIEKDAS